MYFLGPGLSYIPTKLTIFFSEINNIEATDKLINTL